MAALNLIPNFTIVASQAVLFSVNLYVVSKLWVQPYLGLRKKQKAFTVDVQTSAETALGACRARLNDLEQQLQQERISLASWQEQEKQKALHMEKELLEASRKEAVVRMDRYRFELRSHLEEEKNKIPLFVSELSQQCLSIVLHG